MHTFWAWLLVGNSRAGAAAGLPFKLIHFPASRRRADVQLIYTAVMAKPTRRRRTMASGQPKTNGVGFMQNEKIRTKNRIVSRCLI